MLLRFPFVEVRDDLCCAQPPEAGGEGIASLGLAALSHHRDDDDDVIDGDRTLLLLSPAPKQRADNDDCLLDA